MLEAFKDMADPHAMVAAVLWTWTTYMVLLSIPDVTVSKGIAAVMTATLISYMGVDTFWSLIVGFKRLMNEADRATTFTELREAGERYGKVMGRNAARVRPAGHGGPRKHGARAGREGAETARLDASGGAGGDGWVSVSRRWGKWKRSL